MKEVLNSVYMVSSDDGWAVGTDGTILHWNGENWSRVESPTQNDLYNVHFLSPTEGWAVGEDGTILHYTAEAFPYSNLLLPAAIVLVVVLVVLILKQRFAGRPEIQAPKEFEW